MGQGEEGSFNDRSGQSNQQLLEGLDMMACTSESAAKK